MLGQLHEGARRVLGEAALGLHVQLPSAPAGADQRAARVLDEGLQVFRGRRQRRGAAA